MLDAEDDIEVVRTAANADAGIEIVRELRPHVVLMDVSMPGRDGASSTADIEAMDDSIAVAQNPSAGPRRYQASSWSLRTRQGHQGHVSAGVPARIPRCPAVVVREQERREPDCGWQARFSMETDS